MSVLMSALPGLSPAGNICIPHSVKMQLPKKEKKKKERRDWYGGARINLSTYGLRMGNTIVWGHVDLHKFQKNQDYTENLYKILENKDFFYKNR